MHFLMWLSGFQLLSRMLPAIHPIARLIGLKNATQWIMLSVRAPESAISIL